MRALVQRVSAAAVEVGGSVVGEIGAGILVLVGTTHGDTADDVAAIAEKLAGLRIFSDEAGKMNLSLNEVGGSVLLVSQFTLYGDVKRGRRPSFSGAGSPELAERLISDLRERLEELGIRCESGVFGAHMVVSLVNDGPVSLLVESQGGSIV